MVGMTARIRCARPALCLGVCLAAWLQGASPAAAIVRFDPPQRYATGTAAQAFALGQLNGDAALDIAVVNAGDDTITVDLNDGNGAFSPSATLTLSDGAGGIPDLQTATDVAIGDVTWDGKPDIVVAGDTGSSGGYKSAIDVFPGKGDGTFGAVKQFTVWGEQGTGAIALADFT